MTPGNQSLRSSAGRTSAARPINPGRIAASRRLASEARSYPDLSLDPLDTDGLPDRDAALAHAIYDAAVRRWLTLRAVCTRFLRQRWEDLHPEVQAALLVGSAQLLLFDRVPPHAAIDESVEWIKRGENARASGLVNAVLRRVAESVDRDDAGFPIRRDRWNNEADEIPLPDGSALRLRSRLLPGDSIRRASAATGVPEWQVRAWSESIGVDDAMHVAWHGVAAAPTILNVEHADASRDEAWAGHHEQDGCAVFEGSREDLLALLRTHDHVWVQDATSAAALGVLPGTPCSRVVDLCAGRGTKTRQLLARYPQARVLACDIAEFRLRDLARLARSEPRLRVERADELDPALRNGADLVVADVPCSNSGVLARRVEARHRCSRRQIERLNEQQRSIVTSAVELLREGGMLVYSTCSLEPTENERVVEWATRHLGLELVDARSTLPNGGPGCPASHYRDGGFSSLMRRSG